MQGWQKNNSRVRLKNESVWFKTKLVSQFLAFSFFLTNPFYLSYLHAAPVGGDIVGGTGSISQSDLTTTINQNSQNLAIDWQSFDVNTNEKVNFVQPNTSSVALNRILGNNGTTIQGQINANGQVLLVNPNGVYFTSTASINVGGLVASSLDMSPTDFMNGNYIFNEVLDTDGAVINSGIINASLGGNVALIGKQVKNDGLISANLGSVVLAAGKQSVLTFDNQGLIGVKITKEVLQEELGLEQAVINNGEINASGGRVLLTASTSQDVFSQAVNLENLEQATSVTVNEDGSFTLGAGADVLNTGSIDVSSELNLHNTARIILLGENITSSGSIKADTQNGDAGEIEIHAKNKTLFIENSIVSAQALAMGRGGLIKILGDKVGLFDNTQINASGINGGGEILIGGDRQGLNNSVRNADFIYLGENTEVKADATDLGDGGKIITFAKDTAQIHANLYARGGLTSGNGGFIETSGLKGFSITQAPVISASNGNGGLWLIDPYNITIVNTADCAALCNLSSPFTSSVLNSYIDVDLIRQALITSDVSISTGNAPATTAESGDISFQGDLLFAMPGNTTRTLTLDASRNITFTTTSSISRSSNNDSLNLVLNAGGNISLSTDTTGINTYNGSLNVTSGSGFNSGGAILSLGTGTLNLDSISATGDVILGNITAANLSVLNVNSISQQGSTGLTISGTADLSANAATNSIILTNANDFNILKLQGAVADITDSNNINLAGGTSLTTSLKVTAGSNIGDNGAIAISNTGGTAVTTFDAGGNITIDGNNDNFNILNINNARDVDITDSAGGISISANSGTGGGITGTIDLVTSGNGNILDSGEVNVAGNATFTVQNGQSILLDNVNNTFDGTVDFSVLGGGSAKINDLTFYDTSALSLPSIDISGDLNVTGLTVGFGDTIVVGSLTAEAISSATNIDSIFQTNGTSITNSTDTAIFTSNGHLLLDENNNFNNLRIVKSNNATIVDDGGINFAANSGVVNQGGVEGNLDLTVTNGNITSFGEVNAAAAGANSATFTVGDGQSIYLANSNNTFGGDVFFTSGGTIRDIDITDTTALTLDTINVSRNLNIIADSLLFNSTTVGGALTATTTNATAGDISQVAGILDISGTSTFDATRDITLASNNEFQDTVSVVTARDVTLSDVTGIKLGKITTSGNLNVTSDADTSNDNGENITQLTTAGNGIIVAGTTILTANNQDIFLTNSDNNFDSTNTGSAAGALSIVSADEADITDSNSIVFGNVNINRNSGRTSTFISGAGTSGNITQVAGTSFINDRNSGSVSRFDANGGNVNLTNSTNDFRVVRVDSASSASFTDTDAIRLGNISTIGDLSIVAGLTGGSGTKIQDNNANITVGGTLNLTSRTSGGTDRDILLDSTNANYNTVNIVNARDVDITDSTDSVAIQGTVSRNLKLTANGTSTSNVITNSGGLSVTGNAEFIAKAGESIDLSNIANSFTIDPTFATVTGTGNLNNVSITDTTALILQDSFNVDENLTARSVNSTLQFRNTQVGGNLGASANTVLDQAGGTRIIVSGTSTLDGTTIDFTEDNNDFQGAVIVNNGLAGVELKDDVGGITFGDTSNSFLSLSLTVVSTDSSDPTASNITQGNRIVTGNAVFTSDNNITLSNSSNDFTGSVNLTAGNDVVIEDSNALTIESSSSRDLTITTGGDLDFGRVGATSITTIRDLFISAGGQVNQTTDSTLDITRNAQISAISASAITQNVRLDSTTNRFNSVDIQNARNVNLHDSNSSIDIQGANITGALNLTSAGTVTGDVISNSGELNVAGQTNITIRDDQSIDLSHAANTFGQDINITGIIDNLNISDTGSLVLQNNLTTNRNLTVNAQGISFQGDTRVGGDLAATTTTGEINQIGLNARLRVTGISSLDGGQGGITLSRSTNNFGGVVTLQTNSTDTINNPSNVVIRDIGSITIGASSIQGNLTVTADSIDQVDAPMVADGITVTNSASFVAQAGSDIILDNPDNNFNTVSFSSINAQPLGSVSIANTGDLTLSAINVNTNLTATATGDIFNTGQLVVGGLANITANDITLTNLTNDFTNITLNATGNVIVRDTNILNFSGNSSISGDLTVTTGTGITDDAISQILATSGISTFTTGNNTGNTIVLDSIFHDFNEVRVNAGGNITINDINGLDLGVSNARSNLTIVADSDDTGGTNDITNNGGALTVAGNLAIVSSAGSNVTLDDTNNSFTGSLSITGAAASGLGIVDIQNTQRTLLNNINVAGLTISSTGNIEQTGTSDIDVSGNTVLDSASADIILNNSTNEFSGLDVTNARNVGITDATDLSVGSINATGTVTINSTGLNLNSLGANTVILNSGSSSTTIGNITATGGVTVNSNGLNVNNIAADTVALNSGSSSTTIGNITASGEVSVNSNGIILGSISAGTITLDAGSSNIADNNGISTNITSTGTVTLNATGGIGDSNALELAMDGANAKLTAINSGSGNIEVTNTGDITLEDITNNVPDSGFKFIGLDGDVTITKVTLDRSFLNRNAEASFDIKNGNVYADPNSDLHIRANSASFDMNGKGSIGQLELDRPVIVDIPYKLTDINSISTYIQYYQNRAPFIYEGANEFKNKALQAIENIAGQQLIEVEALADVDKAIFTDVRNYSHSDIALMMPSDQRYTEDEEEDEEAKQKRRNLINSTP